MAKKTTKKSDSPPSEGQLPECFVIMPVSDPEGYAKGHFRRVYEDIHRPACEKSGFAPIRADDITQTNLIHLDILQKLVDCPMAICDLSSRNPNVLFELGLRQAFDKPTVLVQEEGTPAIFDIAPLRYTTYSGDLRYRDVLEAQRELANAIIATKEATDAGNGANSIVSILSIAGPAALKEAAPGAIIDLFKSELRSIRSDIRRIANQQERAPTRDEIQDTPGRLDILRQRLATAETLDLKQASPEAYAIAHKVESEIIELISGDDFPPGLLAYARDLSTRAGLLLRRSHGETP